MLLFFFFVYDTIALACIICKKKKVWGFSKTLQEQLRTALQPCSSHWFCWFRFQQRLSQGRTAIIKSNHLKLFSKSGRSSCIVPATPFHIKPEAHRLWIVLHQVRYRTSVQFSGQRPEALIALVITRVPQPLCIQGSDALCPEVGRMLLTKQFEWEPVIGQAKCPPSSRLVHVTLCSVYLICRTDLVHFMDPFLSFNSMITKSRKTECSL